MNIQRLLKKYQLSMDNLGAEILALDEELCPDEAGFLLDLLHKNTDGFNAASPADHQAAALCLRRGGKKKKTKAADLMLQPIHAISSKSTVEQCWKQLEHLNSDLIFLFEDGRWNGAVTRREIRNALRHGFGNIEASDFSRGIPEVVDLETSIDDVKRILNTSISPAIMLTEKHRCVGFIDRESTAGSLLAERLPPNWAKSLDKNRAWVKRIGEAAEEAASRAYLVGGCVRDILIRRKPTDLDFTIIGDTSAVAKILKKNHGGTLQLEALFGAAHWTTPDGQRIDLTTGRTEIYDRPGALPAVSPSHLRADLLRRDFSINMLAICVNPKNFGDLVDPCGGRNDLRKGWIRVVHGLSFLDDPTRIFRAARYAARFNFQLHPDSKRLLARSMKHAMSDSITMERMGKEIDLIFNENCGVRAWKLLNSWNVLEEFLPQIDDQKALEESLMECGNCWETLNSMGIQLQPRSASLWISLASSISEHVQMKQLAAGESGRQKRWIRGPEQIEKVINEIGGNRSKEKWGRALKGTETVIWPCLMARSELLKEAVIWWTREGLGQMSPVDGKTLLEMGCPKGPKVGKALAAAQASAWRGEGLKEQLGAAKAVWT